MSALERYSPADEHEVEKQPHDVVLTNYDRITQDEGKLAGFERSSAEYEQKGLKGLAQKVRYSFLRQAIIRKNIKEAQRQVKSNTETLLLRSPDVEAAAKGLSIDEKPFIHPDEVNAYRASIALNDEHDERIDSRYAAQQNLLEAQLQNRVNALTMSGDRSRIAAEVSTWVDGAIAQLPQYYRSEDKELFVRQITESVERVMDSYARAVAESGDTDAARKIKLHLAGMEKNGGKSRLRTMAAELATHPLVWTGASIGLKALTFAPVVGGVLGALRKRHAVGADLERVQMERLHGAKGREDKYRREMAETFENQLNAAGVIDSIEIALNATNVADISRADSRQVGVLMHYVGLLKQISASGYDLITYDEGQMQRQRLRLLKLQHQAQKRLNDLFPDKNELAGHLEGAARVNEANLSKLKRQQAENQRKLKNKKALRAGLITGGISLTGVVAASVIPDEWVDVAADKVEHAVRAGLDRVQPATAAAQEIRHNSIGYVEGYWDDTQSEADLPANDSAPETGDIVEGPEADASSPNNAESEPQSLWQELVSQQDQRDQSNDQYITYGTPIEGEYNELELEYESAGDGEVVINVSGMEGNADGMGGDEFPEGEQLYAVFYLTEADKAAGNEIRIPIPEDGRLVINEDTHPELMPLFETTDGEVEQQFAVLGIASENDDGSYTFYASNWDNDISPELIKEMKDTVVDVDDNGNEYEEVGAEEEEDKPAEEEEPAPDDEGVDDNGNEYEEVGAEEEEDKPAEEEAPPPDEEADDEEEVVVPPPTPSKREVFMSPAGLTADQRGMPIPLKQANQQPQGEPQRPTVTVSEVPQDNAEGQNQGIPGMAPILGLPTGPLPPERPAGAPPATSPGPGGEAQSPQEPGTSETRSAAGEPQPAGQARGAEADTAQPGEAAAARTGSEPAGPESGGAGTQPAANGEAPRASGSITSENNTDGSGNIIQGNSGAVTLNNGLSGEQLIQMQAGQQAYELERQRIGDEDRNRERQANIRQSEILAEVARTGIDAQAARSDQLTEALLTEVRDELRKANEARSSDPTQAALLASIEANAQALKDSAELQRSTIDAVNRVVEVALNRPEVDLKPVYDVLLPLVSERNKQFSDQLAQVLAGVREANSPDLNIALTNLQQANTELRPNLRVLTGQTFTEIQRARRRAYPRRGRRPLTGRGGTGVGEPEPNVPDATTPVETPSGSPERPEPRQPRPMTEEERQRGRENSAAAMKEDFLHENSSYSFGQDNVNNVRNKARERLRELYPERYKELLPVLRDKITQEFVEPWKQDKGSATERRQWLEQLYDDVFYAELAGEAPAARADATSEPTEQDNEPTPTNSGSTVAEPLRPEFPVRVEDMDDYESGRRAQDRRVEEEYRESNEGRQQAERQRERREARAARRAAERQAPTSRPADEAATRPAPIESLNINPVELQNLSPNQENRRNEFNQNDQPTDEEARGIEIYLKRALNFMPLSNPAKNSLRRDFDRQVEQFVAAWQSGNTTAEDRESRMNEIFSGELVNNLIRERQAEGSTTAESTTINASEEGRSPEQQGPVDGSVHTLERLVKRFSEDRRFNYNPAPLSSLNNERFAQEYTSMVDSHIKEIREGNELTDEQERALQFLTNSYNLFGQNLGARTTQLESQNFEQLQSELSKELADIRSMKSWVASARAEGMTDAEYKAEQVEDIESGILEPLWEKRDNLRELLNQVYADIEGVREQSAQVRPIIENLAGSEALFAKQDEVFERIERVAGELNRQLRDIKAAAIAFERVLEAWKQAA